MVNRHDIEDAMEEWRDDCIKAGIDPGHLIVLYDDNLLKDFARHILVRIRESG